MADNLDLKITIAGAPQLEQALTQLGLDMKDLRSAMQTLGTEFKTFFSGNVFASRGEAIGEPWQRLSPRYAAWKAKHYPGRPPLVRSGLMQRSFRYTTTPMSLVLDNPTPYFKYHQSSEPRHRLPRRVMLKLDDQRRQDATKVIATALAAKIQQRMGH